MCLRLCHGAVVMYARSHANAIKIINWTELRRKFREKFYLIRENEIRDMRDLRWKYS